MSAEPPALSGPDSDDPIGTRYPNTARIPAEDRGVGWHLCGDGIKDQS